MLGKWPNNLGQYGLLSCLLIGVRRCTANVFRGFKILNLLLLCFYIAGLSWSHASIASAAIVRQIPFSAALKSPSTDLPVPDGNYSIVFRLYTVETGGTAVYTETQTVGVTNGVVSVNIGSVTAIPTSVDFNSTYYLGIQVASDAEMSPRRKIGSVPAAFNASTVDGKSPGVGANNVLLLDSSGNIDIAGTITTGGNITLQGSLIPTVGSTYDLGTALKPFSNAYIDNLVVGSTSSSGTSSASFTVNDDASGDENSALNFYRGGALTAAQLLWNSSTDLFNLNNGLAITGVLTTTSTINTATISGGTLSGGTVSGGSLSATAVNGLSLASGVISGQLAVSTNGAASTPAQILSGTWFTGGTSTTTKPQILVEPTGTTSTGWSTSGTGLGVNAASGFAGNLVDLQVAGASKLSVTSDGVLTTASTINGATISGGTLSGGSLSASAANGLSLASGVISSQLAVSTNGAASTPAGLLSGTWFTGGTSTTTKPQLLIQPTAATSTSWSTNGTGLGVNASSGFTGNLLDLQTNGVSRVKVKSTGTIAIVPSDGNTYPQALDLTAGLTSIDATTLNIRSSGAVRLGDMGSSGNVSKYFELQVISAQSYARANMYSGANATANYGVFNIGQASTSFDGATAGFFVGSSSGTQLAINAASGFSGNLADWQVAGVNKFRVTSAGAVTTGSTINSQTISSAANFTGTVVVATSLSSPIITSDSALALTSATNSNISITPNGTGDIQLVVSGNASQDVFIGDGGTSNYAKFDTNGSLSFAGAARPYSEIIMVPKESTVPVSNGCTLNQTDATNHSYYTNDCDATTDESAFWQFKMPSNYATGTNVQVDVYWEANATSGAAVLDVGYVGVADGEAWDVASITNVAGSAKTTAGTAYLVNTSTVTLTSPDISADDLVSLRILRDANNGSDTLAVDAKVLKVRIKYLVAN